MHIVHEADDEQNGIGLSAVGILFSVNDYTANLSPEEQEIIDEFFDSLNFEDLSNPQIPEANFAELMNLADFDNRWVYLGSVTTPPCQSGVYWNLLKTVYPISQRHLDLFKGQLAQGEEGNLADFGNYRETQPIVYHRVISVTGKPRE